jgi:dUTPase
MPHGSYHGHGHHHDHGHNFQSEPKRIRLSYEKLNPELPDLERSRSTDSGFDLTVDRVTWDDQYPWILTLHSGIKFSIPEGYGLDIRPRSSIYKYPILLTNSVGTIDQTYTSEVLSKVVLLKALGQRSDHARTVANNMAFELKGKRVVQVVFHQVPEVEFMQVLGIQENRGGFGSTGD